MRSIFRRVFLASDASGVEIKNELCDTLDIKKDYFLFDSIIDYGSFNSDFVNIDYPHYVKVIAQCVKYDDSCGVLFSSCATAMSIAANRFNNVRAALCKNVRSVFFSRLQANANVLIIDAENSHSKEELDEMLKIFFTTNFIANSKYKESLAMIDNITDDSVI